VRKNRGREKFKREWSQRRTESSVSEMTRSYMQDIVRLYGSTRIAKNHMPEEVEGVKTVREAGGKSMSDKKMGVKVVEDRRRA
jgi:hypothetical protein